MLNVFALILLSRVFDYRVSLESGNVFPNAIIDMFHNLSIVARGI